MAEQRPLSTPTVPSNAPDYLQPTSNLVRGSYAGPTQVQQHYLQYQPQQQQQQQQHFQQTRRMASQVPPSAQPLTINTGQRLQLYQQVQLPQADQPRTPQTPQTTSLPPEQALRDQVVSLLASTANGCIAELGYPALLTEYQQLQPAYAKLVEECAGMRNDNFRMAQLLVEQKEESRKREENETQVIHGLKERIAQLEKEQELLKRQHRVLQQTHAMNASDAYKILEAKYNYVLEMLKRHHAPIATQFWNRDGEVRIRSAPTSVGNQFAANDTNKKDAIDLTAESRKGFPMNVNETTGQPTQPAQPASQPGAYYPESVQGSSTRPFPASSSAPPMPTQQLVSTPPPAEFGRQKPVRAASLPAPVPSRPSASTMVDLHYKPLSSPMSGLANVGEIPNDQNASPPAAQSAIGQVQDVGLVARSITRALVHNPPHIPITAPKSQRHASSSHTASSAPPAEQGRLTIRLPHRSISQQVQSQPQSQSLPVTPSVPAPSPVPPWVRLPSLISTSSVRRPRPVVNPYRLINAESSSHARSRAQRTNIAPFEEARPRLVVNPYRLINAESSSHARSRAQHTNIAPFEEARPRVQVQDARQGSADRLTPTPLTPISALAAKDTLSVMQPSRHTTPAVAVPDLETEEEVPQESASQSQAQTPNSAPSISSAALPTKDAQPMDIDENEKSPTVTKSREEDVVMAEGETPDVKERPAPDASGAPTQSTSEEEEEEEVWDDLTDDEDDGKQPVLDCISSIFYDDEKDERLCHFCNARLEKLNLPDPRPLFTDCSMRDLIMHGKNEHSPVWEKLRQTRAESP